MAQSTMRFHAVTGGPGSGKSTLLDALAATGLSRTVEAGRAIIQDQVAIGGSALPWRNPAAFAEQMLAWDMRSHHMAQDLSGSVLFDRAVPDVLGFLELSGLAVPVHMEAAARRFRYHPQVFIAPPWREIFHRDAERRQDFAEACRTYEAMAGVYRRLGYRLVELPRVSVEERVRFVRAHLGLAPQPVPE